MLKKKPKKTQDLHPRKKWPPAFSEIAQKQKKKLRMRRVLRTTELRFSVSTIAEINISLLQRSLQSATHFRVNKYRRWRGNTYNQQGGRNDGSLLPQFLRFKGSFGTNEETSPNSMPNVSSFYSSCYVVIVG